MQQKGTRPFVTKNRTNFTRGVYGFILPYLTLKKGCSAKIYRWVMSNEKMAYKKLDVRIFKNTSKNKEIITDLAGNTFLTRQAVARLFGCSLPTLATTYKRKGLRPLDRYVKGYKVYLLDDVEQMYNRRAAY